MVNALDDPKASDESGIYLTVTGLSAEQGDDGEVGRGNRVNGLITPSRAMSLEAAAGKNAVAHVGKLYNLWRTEWRTPSPPLGRRSAKHRCSRCLPSADPSASRPSWRFDSCASLAAGSFPTTK